MRWFNKKYGREVDNREWVKVHLMCGVNTKVVTAVDISGWAANDTNYFIPLVERTAKHFEVREVSADKAYLSKKNLEAVESLGGIPFVPFKSNTLEPTKARTWARPGRGRRCTTCSCTRGMPSWSTTTREAT